MCFKLADTLLWGHVIDTHALVISSHSQECVLEETLRKETGIRLLFSIINWSCYIWQTREAKFKLQTRTVGIDISHLFSCNTDKTVHLQKLQTWNPFCKCNGSNNCGRFQNVNIHLIIRNHCILISVWWPQDDLCIYKTLLHTAHLICKKNIFLIELWFNWDV